MGMGLIRRGGGVVHDRLWTTDSVPTSTYPYCLPELGTLLTHCTPYLYDIQAANMIGEVSRYVGTLLIKTFRWVKRESFECEDVLCTLTLPMRKVCEERSFRPLTHITYPPRTVYLFLSRCDQLQNAYAGGNFGSVVNFGHHTGHLGQEKKKKIQLVQSIRSSTRYPP
jgi:hypothetical protein